MKKLLSFLAAGIAALGLASCSGDLHNEYDPSSDIIKALFDTSIDISEFETFELVGSMTGWSNNADTNLDFTEDTDGTWYVDFSATTEEDEAFCFVTKTGQWGDYQIGGDKMEGGELPDGITFEAKDNGNGGLNGTLSGLSVDTFYRMTVDASTGTYVISIEKTVPTPFYLEGFFVCGSHNNGAADGTSVLLDSTLDKSTYNVTYVKQFVFDASTNADWGQTAVDSQISFGITKGSSWDVKYTGATAAVGASSYTATTLGATSNNLITGLVDGSTYQLYIQTTPLKEVSIKVVKVVPVTYTVNLVVTNFPDSANGMTAVVNGTFNSWPGWQSCWGGSTAVSAVPNATISNNTATFTALVSDTALVGESITYSGCGYYGTESGDDIATAAGEIKVGGDNFNIEFTLSAAGTYVATLDLAADSISTALSN